jgi:hypothetical protein
MHSNVLKVVVMGQGLEAMTDGICVSTTHRVLSPAAGSGPRISIPFFQGVSYDATFENMDVPEEIKILKQEILQKEGGWIDDVEMTFKKGGDFKHLGEATLMNRVKVSPPLFPSPQQGGGQNNNNGEPNISW